MRSDLISVSIYCKNPEKVKEMRKWVCDELKSECGYVGVHRQYNFLFYDEEDAMAFKLKWT